MRKRRKVWARLRGDGAKRSCGRSATGGGGWRWRDGGGVKKAQIYVHVSAVADAARDSECG